MLGKKTEDGLIAPNVLLLDAWIVEVGTSGHPAVDLVLERLDVFGALKVRLELLDRVVGLLLGRQQDKGRPNALSVPRVDHSGVALSAGLEDGAIGLGDEGNDLTAPAVLRCTVSRYEKSKRRKTLTPIMAQSMISGYLALAALSNSGTWPATFVGGFFWKKAPRFSCFSGVLGGYQSIGQGLPSNQSGIRTRYCCLWLVARMSAPWIDWGK